MTSPQRGKEAESAKSSLDAYFDWTFYDQGTRSLADGTEARTGSVGDFFEQALVFFGDPDPNLPGKGRRLADLIRQQRSLIILDGLEPLQQPPGHPQAGRLLDPDLRDLLAALAQSNPGLCLITSRQALTDIDGLRRKVYVSHDLEDLPIEVAIKLLRQFDIRGRNDELSDACEKFRRHALSLTLLGRFLTDAHGGDIRRIDRIDLQRADELTRPERHRSVWRILENYEAWLAKAQDDGSPKTLAVLRLTGLFDRTATADCLAALRAEPIIPGLTDAICGLADDEWNILLKRLESAHLIKLRESSTLKSPSSDSAWAIDAHPLDAHPLIREYFAKQLKQTQPEAFKAAHSRLFDQLCEASDFQPDTLEELQPLYQAIAHGCLAERFDEARANVYRDRILRGTDNTGFYSWKKLGASADNLRVVMEFFGKDWTLLPQDFSAASQAWLLSEAANSLRALGRVEEALDPMRRGMDLRISEGDWINAAISAGNVSELELTLGRISDAETTARRAVRYADLGMKLEFRSIAHSKVADPLHQSGRREESRGRFNQSERIQKEWSPRLPLLYSVRGFQFADLLLSLAERSAWLAILTGDVQQQTVKSAHEACLEVIERLGQIFSWTTRSQGLLSVSLDHLALARAQFYRAQFSDQSFTVSNHLDSAISIALIKSREAKQLDHLPLALLTAGFFHGTLGENLEEAERLLEEAQQIAERGPMPLYLADVHLHRARLFGRLPKDERESKFPDIDPKAELAEARRLIENHGYSRRKEELEDAEAATVNW